MLISSTDWLLGHVLLIIRDHFKRLLSLTVTKVRCLLGLRVVRSIKIKGTLQGWYSHTNPDFHLCLGAFVQVEVNASLVCFGVMFQMVHDNQHPYFYTTDILNEFGCFIPKSAMPFDDWLLCHNWHYFFSCLLRHATLSYHKQSRPITF